MPIVKEEYIMGHNPDDRSDNVEKLQQNIADTVKKIHDANEMLVSETNPQTIAELIDKNARREEALGVLRSEVKEEAKAREKGCH